MLDFAYGLTAPETERPPVELLPGAFAEIARFGAERDDKAVRTTAFRAARAVAALPLLRQLARRGDASEPWTLNLERGALLCLLHEREAGIDALRAADEGHRRGSEHGDGSDGARLGIVACALGPAGEAPALDETKLGLDPRRVRPEHVAALAALQAAEGLPDGAERALALLVEQPSKLTPSVRLHLLPLGVRALQHVSVAEVLALLAPEHGPGVQVEPGRALGPWQLLGVDPSPEALVVDADGAQSLATELEAMVGNLDPKATEPVPCAAQGCAEATARAHPAATLNAAASALWRDCAAEWARRGQRDRAESAAARARALGPTDSGYELAAVYLAVRNADAALEVLDPLWAGIESEPPEVRWRARIDQALALAHLGRFQEAFGAAEQAFAAAEQSSGPAPEGKAAPPALTVDAEAQRVAAGWLWAAIALRVQREAEVLARLPAPPGKDMTPAAAGADSLVAVASWLRLGSPTAMTETERRPLRWDLGLHLGRGSAAAEVLPAVMVVVGAAVPSSSDVEVWLDRIFDQVHRQDPVWAMRARAEAARWRGDGRSAVEWETRAGILTGLIEDYPSALLARFAALR